MARGAPSHGKSKLIIRGAQRYAVIEGSGCRRNQSWESTTSRSGKRRNRALDRRCILRYRGRVAALDSSQMVHKRGSSERINWHLGWIWEKSDYEIARRPYRQLPIGRFEIQPYGQYSSHPPLFCTIILYLFRTTPVPRGNHKVITSTSCVPCIAPATCGK